MRLLASVLIVALSCGPLSRAQAQLQGPPTLEFGGATLLVPEGQQIEQSPATLRFTADALVIESRKTNDPLKQFGYGEIKGAEYSYSQYPRWKEGLGASAAATSILGATFGTAALGPLAVVIALPVFFKVARMKGKHYWLTIKTNNDFAVVRLDKSNYKLIIPALETRTGIKVETVAAEK